MLDPLRTRHLRLYNQKVINSSTCSYCDEVDDLLHYFVKCGSVIFFWKQLELWWNRVSTVNVILTPKHIIIFGIYYDSEYFSSVNHVILLAKWYIYNCKRNHNTIHLFNFLSVLKRNLQIEEYISAKNNTSDIFNKKWQHISDKI